MENSIEKDKQSQEEIKMRDTYNDEHWQKKYGVSADELTSNEAIGIPAKIIQVNSRHNTISA